MCAQPFQNNGLNPATYYNISVNLAVIPWKSSRTPGVSCAAGGRVERGGRRYEAAARQCACGRPLEHRESGLPEAPEGWGMWGRQQAVAFCRVDRAQLRDAPAASVARPGWVADLFSELLLYLARPFFRE